MISNLLGFFSSASADVSTGSAVADGGTDFFATVLAAVEGFIGGFGS